MNIEDLASPVADVSFIVKDPSMSYILSERENILAVTTMATDKMVSLVNDLEFEANLQLANEILKRKAIAAQH